MKYVVWGLVLLLVILHQDVWNWNDDRLIFGFLPLTLFYHACISLAAGFAWLLAILFAWPAGLDDDLVIAPTKPVHDAPAVKGGAA